MRPGHRSGIRAIIVVADIGTNPEDYSVEVFEEPFDHNLQDADGIAALDESLVQAPAAEIFSTVTDMNA